jgi:hypothetical protein
MEITDEKSRTEWDFQTKVAVGVEIIAYFCKKFN